MVFCSLIASSAIRAFISALKLRRCLDFISAPFPRQRFYTLLTGPNFGEYLTVPLRANISETVLVLLINEQGEKAENRNERQFSWCCSFPWGFGCRGTERRRA